MKKRNIQPVFLSLEEIDNRPRGNKGPKVPIKLRFLDKINKDGLTHPRLGTKCWLWEGCTSGDGYGFLNSRFNQIKAHRCSWMVHIGPIPMGKDVLHDCDVKLCVNPAHLKLGSDVENHKDRIRDGKVFLSHGRPDYKKDKKQ